MFSRKVIRVLESIGEWRQQRRHRMNRTVFRKQWARKVEKAAQTSNAPNGFLKIASKTPINVLLPFFWVPAEGDGKIRCIKEPGSQRSHVKYGCRIWEQESKEHMSPRSLLFLFSAASNIVLKYRNVQVARAAQTSETPKPGLRFWTLERETHNFASLPIFWLPHRAA